MLLPHHATSRTVSPVIDRRLNWRWSGPSSLRSRTFQDQVVRFLDSEIVELYDDPATWERTQTYVAERLSELRP